MASPVKKEGRKTTLQFLLLLLLRLGISSKPEQQLRDLDSWFFFSFSSAKPLWVRVRKRGRGGGGEVRQSLIHTFPFPSDLSFARPVFRLTRGEGNSLSFDAGDGEGRSQFSWVMRRGIRNSTILLFPQKGRANIKVKIGEIRFCSTAKISVSLLLSC